MILQSTLSERSPLALASHRIYFSSIRIGFPVMVEVDPPHGLPVIISISQAPASRSALCGINEEAGSPDPISSAEKQLFQPDPQGDLPRLGASLDPGT